VSNCALSDLPGGWSEESDHMQHFGSAQSLLPRAALEFIGPGPDAALLPAFAAEEAAALCRQVQELVAISPWRHMLTPGGQRMSVAMSNCGRAGWISDRAGYRYQSIDPHSGRPWPQMPRSWSRLAASAARQAGFGVFEPDACLINRYEPGARLTLHQDRNERDFSAPVVSVSLGLAAVFLFGGARREAPVQPVPLFHGDVVVWGRARRLSFHGVRPLADGEHPLLGRCRVNLTFRRAL
jgi:alkylated DNA repair protein (DNA oxidative demethylase)